MEEKLLEVFTRIAESNEKLANATVHVANCNIKQLELLQKLEPTFDLIMKFYEMFAPFMEQLPAIMEAAMAEMPPLPKKK